MFESIKNDIKKTIEEAIEGIEVTDIDLSITLTSENSSVCSIKTIVVKYKDIFHTINFKDDSDGSIKDLVKAVQAKLENKIIL